MKIENKITRKIFFFETMILYNDRNINIHLNELVDRKNA